MAARRTLRLVPKAWAIALGLSWATCVACGGNATSSKGAEASSAGGGSGLADGKTSGGSANGGDAVALGGSAITLGGSSDGSGGATDASPKVSCQDLRNEAPGKPVYDRALVGGGECQGMTLGDTIDRILAEHPELADITTLYAPDPERGGDGSFIYAFQKLDGTFALVFKRGGGDCPAGCTENDYWYFDTVGHCDISPEGHTRRAFDGVCLPVDELPKWGIPPAAAPESICGASSEPQDLSGDYAIYLCGQRSACATSAEGSKPMDLPNVVKLHIVQDAADLTHGTVTLSGTGEPLLDGSALTASFAARHFHAEEHISNLPAACPASHDLTLDYDFEGFGQRRVSLFQTGTPDCAAKPNDYCKGSLEADLGRQLRDP